MIGGMWDVEEKASKLAAVAAGSKSREPPTGNTPIPVIAHATKPRRPSLPRAARPVARCIPAAARHPPVRAENIPPPPRRPRPKGGSRPPQRTRAPTPRRGATSGAAAGRRRPSRRAAAVWRAPAAPVETQTTSRRGPMCERPLRRTCIFFLQRNILVEARRPGTPRAGRRSLAWQCTQIDPYMWKASRPNHRLKACRKPAAQADSVK